MVADVTNLVFAGSNRMAAKSGDTAPAQTEVKANVSDSRAAAARTQPEEQDLAVKELDLNQIDLEELAASLNDVVQNIRRELKFSIDDDTGRTVIKVLNADTQEVVRQIPREEILQLVKNIQERTGTLLDAKA